MDIEEVITKRLPYPFKPNCHEHDLNNIKDYPYSKVACEVECFMKVRVQSSLLFQWCKFSRVKPLMLMMGEIYVLRMTQVVTRKRSSHKKTPAEPSSEDFNDDSTMITHKKSMMRRISTAFLNDASHQSKNLTYILLCRSRASSIWLIIHWLEWVEVKRKFQLNFRRSRKNVVVSRTSSHNILQAALAHVMYLRCHVLSLLPLKFIATDAPLNVRLYITTYTPRVSRSLTGMGL